MIKIISTIALLICTLGNLAAQNLLDQKIDISFRNQSIYRCLKAIEKKANLTFSYNVHDIKCAQRKISESYQNQTIAFILTSILVGSELQYTELANQITVYVKKDASNGIVNLSGFMVDKASKEKLIGARLYFPELKVGCTSNAYGYYYLEIRKGSFDAVATSVGMKEIQKSLNISQNMTVNFELEEDTLLLNVVDVTHTTKADEIKDSEMSIGLEKIAINPQIMNQIPSTNGLPDVTKYIQNIAGIQPLHDGSSAYQVRGLSNGNNLILLDEIPIYHPNHSLGIHSIINTNAVRSVNIYKDYIPSNFGIRNSSILQVYTKEGNLNKYEVSAGLGASIPNVSLEGPIIKNKASFYISGRRSFNPPIAFSFLPQSKLPFPNFYDVTVKLNYKIDYANRIYLTSYIGNDKIKTGNSSFLWGNNAFSFRWNKVISEKMFRNLTLINSTFRNLTLKDSVSDIKDRSQLKFGQRIISSQIKYDLTYFLSNDTKLVVGGSILNTRTRSDEFLTETIFLNRNSYETALYASIKHKISPKLTLNAGARLPFHHHIGTQDTSTFLQPNNVLKTIIYDKNKLYDFKFTIDPRILFSYRINARNTLQWSANIVTQFTHIINFNTRVLPVQIWINPSKYLKPSRNYQTSLGWQSQIKNFTISTTAYYRFVKNTIDFATVNFANISTIESRLLSGKMNTYGAEFSAQYQKTKKYSAKFAYAYNRSRQTIEGINKGLPYEPDYNRPHFVTFSQFFNRSKKWQFGVNFSFHSQTAITLPTSKAQINGIEVPIYSDLKNETYLPSHDRLDLSFHRTLGIKKKKNHGALTFTITNFYNSQNISNAYVNYFFEPNQVSVIEQNFIPFQIYLYYTIKF